jgi:hypothetical protein
LTLPEVETRVKAPLSAVPVVEPAMQIVELFAATAVAQMF